LNDAFSPAIVFEQTEVELLDLIVLRGTIPPPNFRA